MSDEIFPTATRQIDIPARFIRQAMEHIENTGNRYVTFLFAGEQVIDAICVGVTTRLLITDQRRTASPTPTPEPDVPWTVQTLTDEAVLAKMRELGSATVRKVGDSFGLPGHAIAQRQRIRRVLSALTEERLLTKREPRVGFPIYSIAVRKSSQPPPTMPIHAGRRVTRKDITDDKLLALIEENGGRMSSRAMGDAMNIPRPDNLVRGKITQLIFEMTKAGRVRYSGENEEGGGRLYELVPATETDANTDANVEEA
jgi:hypothetical protein